MDNGQNLLNYYLYPSYKKMNRIAKIIIIIQIAVILLYGGLTYNYKCDAEIQTGTALMNLEKARINQQEAKRQAKRAQENQSKANAAAATAVESMNKLKKCKNGE